MKNSRETKYLNFRPYVAQKFKLQKTGNISTIKVVYHLTFLLLWLPLPPKTPPKGQIPLFRRAKFQSYKPLVLAFCIFKITQFQAQVFFKNWRKFSILCKKKSRRNSGGDKSRRNLNGQKNRRRDK